MRQACPEGVAAALAGLNQMRKLTPADWEPTTYSEMRLLSSKPDRHHDAYPEIKLSEISSEG